MYRQLLRWRVDPAVLVGITEDNKPTIWTNLLSPEEVVTVLSAALKSVQSGKNLDIRVGKD